MDQAINPPQHQDQQPGLEIQMHPKPDFMPKFAGNGRLEGKVAIITGGDSGIGRACAVLFAREGAEVALVYLNETEDAKVTAQAVRAEGKDPLLIRGDIGEPAFCDNIVGKVIEEFGRLDVLVNNAAEQHPQDEITDISPHQLQRTFQTNLYGQPGRQGHPRQRRGARPDLDAADPGHFRRRQGCQLWRRQADEAAGPAQ